VNQYAQKAFAVLSVLTAGSQGGAQMTLVLRNSALYLPPLTIESPKESPSHLSAVSRGGPFPRVPFACRDNRRPNPQTVSTERMVVLCVVGGIGKHPVESNVSRCLNHRCGKLRRVVRRTPAHRDSGNQVSSRMADKCQLWPAPAPESVISLTVNVVRTGMPTLQTSSVSGAFGTLVYQAETSGAFKSVSEQVFKSPFFMRRFSA
jgi:hypothetical protein